MERRRVFLSHSAHNGTDVAIRDQVYAELDGHFDAFMDRKRLIPGEQWYDGLFTEMENCDAAVVLVSREAVSDLQNYPWVYRETDKFYWRKRTEVDFPLLLVLMPGITPADLNAAPWNSLEAKSYLVVGYDPAEIAALCKALVALLDEKLPPTGGEEHRLPAGRLARVLAGAVPETALLQAAVVMGAEGTVNWPKPQWATRLAWELLHAEYAQFIKGLRELCRPLGPEQAQALVNHIASYWVNPGAALTVAKVATSQEVPKPVAGMHALRVRTGEFCAQRFGATTLPRCVIVPLKESGAGADIESWLVRQIREEVNRRDPPFDYDESPADLDARINSQTSTTMPIVVVVRHAVGKDVIERLRARYGRVTYIVLSGDDPPTNLPYKPLVVIENWSRKHEDEVVARWQEASRCANGA